MQFLHVHILKPPIETITAIAMMRTRKISFILTSIICGFFSGSTIPDEAGEEEGRCLRNRSSIAMAGSCWRKSKKGEVMIRAGVVGILWPYKPPFFFLPAGVAQPPNAVMLRTVLPWGTATMVPRMGKLDCTVVVFGCRRRHVRYPCTNTDNFVE